MKKYTPKQQEQEPEVTPGMSEDDIISELAIATKLYNHYFFTDKEWNQIIKELKQI